MAKYEGGCACGTLRYATDAEPVMAAHCQCSICQKLSGTGHASFAVFPEPAVTIAGEPKYWSYTADSGNQASRGHCTNCGAMVFGRTDSFKGMLGIMLGSLDVPSRITPQISAYSSRAQPWDYLDPAINRFPAMPQM